MDNRIRVTLQLQFGRKKAYRSTPKYRSPCTALVRGLQIPMEHIGNWVFRQITDIEETRSVLVAGGPVLATAYELMKRFSVEGLHKNNVEMTVSSAQYGDLEESVDSGELRDELSRFFTTTLPSILGDNLSMPYEGLFIKDIRMVTGSAENQTSSEETVPKGIVTYRPSEPTNDEVFTNSPESRNGSPSSDVAGLRDIKEDLKGGNCSKNDQPDTQRSSVEIEGSSIGNVIVDHSTKIFTKQVVSTTDAESPRRANESDLPTFKAKVLERLEKQINVIITPEFGDLKEPTFEVIPELKEIKFYSGSHVYQTKQYRSELSGNERQRRSGQKVELNNLHGSGKRFKRSVCLVGGAGSGKTTLTKWYSRNVMRGNVPALSGVEMVHYVNVRDLPTSHEKITSQQMLFDKMMPDLVEEESMSGFQWIRENQDKILFVFDGLDQATWSLRGKYDSIRYDEAATVEAIMYNILSGTLFPKSWILTSAREHAIRMYGEALRPDKVVALAGLTQPSIKRLVSAFIDTGDEEENWIMVHLREKSPSLLSLCSTPMFLVFIVIVLVENPNDKPDTLSGIMIRLFQNHIRSAYFRQTNKLEVFKNLKKLSFDGMQNGQVLFTTDHLKKFDLDPEIAKDLVIIVPELMQNYVSDQLLEGDFILFFCHQSIQEALAALCVAEMPQPQFREFVHNELFKPHWSVVQRITCGILMNSETLVHTKHIMEDLSPKHLREKRKYLSESLVKQIQEGNDQLALYNSLNECGDSARKIIRDHLHGVSLSEIPLTVSDIHAVGTVLGKSLRLESVSFWSCDLNPDVLKVFESRLQDSTTVVRNLNINDNWDLGEEGYAIISRIVRKTRVREIRVRNSKLDTNKIRRFRQELEGYESRISILDFSAPVDPLESDIQELILLLPFVSDKLVLRAWKLEGELRAALQNGLNSIDQTNLKIECSATNYLIQE